MLWDATVKLLSAIYVFHCMCRRNGDTLNPACNDPLVAEAKVLCCCNAAMHVVCCCRQLADVRFW